MNDQQLELRIRRWYAVEIDERVVAPTALRASVRTIARQAPPARAVDRRWLLLAVAAFALLTFGTALAIGSGLLREESTPRPTLSAPPSAAPTLATSVPSDGVVDAVTTTALSFAGGATTPDLTAVVGGPDGVPYVIDRARKAVYRVDVTTSGATAVLTAGEVVDGATVGEPRLMATAGRSLVVLDHENALWRWQPSGDQGEGVVSRLELNGVDDLGDDLAAMATYCRNAPECSLNNLYLVDPSGQTIRASAPAADGSGYPAAPTSWLQTPRDMTAVSALYVDGDVFLVDGGEIVRFTAGAQAVWDAAPPGDGPAAEPPAYRFISSASGRRVGRLYAFEAANDTVVAFDKATGAYVARYRAGDGSSFSEMRGMYVEPGAAGGPDTLWWIDQSGLQRSVLDRDA